MRPHDIVVLLKILTLGKDWKVKELSDSLFISEPAIRKSLNRSATARLLSPDKKRVFKHALFEVIVYGLKYVFPVQPGARVKGIATSHSSPILKDYFIFEKKNQYVWPSESGQIEGYAVKPFYPKQPIAAHIDQLLYDRLALIDAIRVGRTRERNKAVELLKAMLIQECPVTG